MTAKERLWLAVTFSLTLLFYTWIISWKFALIAMFSIFIHEYGHYWWMGREGIANRSMLFIPPFGALAMAKEPWPTLLAEARIALAGPIVGLLPGIIFLAIWSAFPHQTIWPAAVLFVAYLNLFNLLFPSPITDGGRVVKSLAFSVSPKLGIALFVITGVILLGGIIFIRTPLLIIFLMLVLWQSWTEFKRWQRSCQILAASPQFENTGNPITDEEWRFLESCAFVNRMSVKQILAIAVTFFNIVSTYLLLFWFTSTHSPVNFYNFLSAFN